MDRRPLTNGTIRKILLATAMGTRRGRLPLSKPSRHSVALFSSLLTVPHGLPELPCQHPLPHQSEACANRNADGSRTKDCGSDRSAGIFGQGRICRGNRNIGLSVRIEQVFRIKLDRETADVRPRTQIDNLISVKLCLSAA